jgi:PDGLE domain-containing protein
VSRRLFLALALAMAVALAFAVSPYASSSPDGLERVATDKGFVERGKLHRAQKRSPVPDYAFPGIHDPRLATGVAGFVGTLGVFAVGLGTASALRRRQRV